MSTSPYVVTMLRLDAWANPMPGAIREPVLGVPACPYCAAKGRADATLEGILGQERIRRCASCRALFELLALEVQP